MRRWIHWLRDSLRTCGPYCLTRWVATALQRQVLCDELTLVFPEQHTRTFLHVFLHLTDDMFKCIRFSNLKGWQRSFLRALWRKGCRSPCLRKLGHLRRLASVHAACLAQAWTASSYVWLFPHLPATGKQTRTKLKQKPDTIESQWTEQQRTGEHELRMQMTECDREPQRKRARRKRGDKRQRNQKRIFVDFPNHVMAKYDLSLRWLEGDWPHILEVIGGWLVVIGGDWRCDAHFLP